MGRALFRIAGFGPCSQDISTGKDGHDRGEVINAQLCGDFLAENHEKEFTCGQVWSARVKIGAIEFFSGVQRLRPHTQPGLSSRRQCEDTAERDDWQPDGHQERTA